METINQISHNQIQYKNILFELADNQVLIKDALTKELIKVKDVKPDFDINDMIDWAQRKLGLQSE